MSKLFKLKEWLTLDEAVAHISSVVGEIATVADLYRFALDGHLTLSANFFNQTYARAGKLVKTEDVEFIEVTAENNPFLFDLYSDLANKYVKDDADKKELFMQPANGEIEVSEDCWINLEDDIVKIKGIWDLPMIGSERLDIEHFYQQLTSGLEVKLINIEGTFVQKGEVICQLQTDFDDNEYQPFSLAQKENLERYIDSADISVTEAKKLKTEFDEGRAKYLSERASGIHSRDYFPSGGLDEHDYVLVVRTNELTRFIHSLDDSQSKPLSTQGRNAYLKTIYTLSKALTNGLTGSHTKDAELVLSALAEKGFEAPQSAKTLGKYLKEAKELFEEKL